MIHIKNIKKSFKQVEVLKGVNLTVEKGKITALLGSNGAGKTTLIKMMSTLLKPDEGSIHIGGVDCAKNPHAIRRMISLTGQFTAVDDQLTGFENLKLIARLKHLKHPAALAQQQIQHFGMATYAQRKVSSYSGGMTRRLDIAMSLMGEPEVLFLDEPTTGLDPEGRIEVWKMIKSLSASGMTILLTTQYLDEAEQLADQIAILDQGVIICQDTFEGLKQLFPPTKVEYVEKQPSLEDIFFALVNGGEKHD